MPDSSADNKQKTLFDPNTAKPMQDNKQTLEFDPSTARAVDKGLGGHARDLGTSLMSGLASVPDVVVGVADIATGGHAGKAVDNLSDHFKLGDAQKFWQSQKTDQAKVQSQEFNDADGIVDKTKVALSNPSMIGNTVVESLPSMVVGGLAGRGMNVLSKGAINPITAGAAGEGLVMAGAQAEQIRQQTDDGLLNAKQTAAAAGTGVAGGLLGYLGGAVAKRLGFEDVDSLMARGVNPDRVAQEIQQIPFSSIPKSIVLGAISEGLLEEMPQSVTEQVLQNYALNKDNIFEGVDEAIVMGTLAGMAMGGTVAGVSQTSKWAGQNPTDTGENGDFTSNVPMLPLPNGGSGNTNGLQSEFIPGDSSRNTQNQTRQNFEYDQMSTDADNQIGYSGHSRQYAPTPSAQMGLDPNLGPLSAAAATAVDTGVTQSVQPLLESTAQSEQSNPNSVPTDYRQLMGDQNEQSNRSGTEATGMQPTAFNKQGLTETKAIQQKQLEDVDAQLANVEQQLVNEKSVPKKMQLRKRIESLKASRDEIVSQHKAIEQQTKIENAAHEAASSTMNDLPEPTQAQIEAGNYKKGHIKVHGLDIAVENPRGSERRGTDPNGKEWSHTMSDHYGYIKRTTGADNEHIDTYVGPNPESDQIFVVDQIDQQSGGFDEHKVMIGFNSQEDAIKAYSSNFDKGWKVGPVRAMSKDEFKTWLKEGNTQEPVSEIKSKIENDSLDDLPNSYNENTLRVQVRHLSLQASREAKAANEKDSNYISDLGNSAAALLNEKVKQLLPNLYNRAVQLAKSAEISPAGRRGNIRFSNLSFKDDSSFVSGDPWPQRPTKDEILQQAIWHLSQNDNNGKLSNDDISNKKTKNQTSGKTKKVYTPGSNREIEVLHKVVEVDSLIASNEDNGAVNPKFPQALQPRDRSRPASQAQIHEIANKLNPALLGENPSTSSGAPIVSKDGVVESGNGRTLALRKAYEQGKAEEYKKWLSEQGYDVTGMKHPVLVRERLTDLSEKELLNFTKESNESTTLSMSPTEQAMQDAKLIMSLLDEYRDGEITSVANRNFVNKFVTLVVPTSERGKVLNAQTGLSQDGKRRIQAAMVAAAYNDSFIVDQVFEDGDSDIKAIGNALMDVSGTWAKMRDASENGLIPKDLNVTPNLLEAVHLIQKARTTNVKLAELVAQDDIFSGTVDQMTLDFLSVFYRGTEYTRARSRERVADSLNHYAQLALKESAGENLFGEKPKTNNQLLQVTHDRLNEQETDKQQDIFASTGPNESNTNTLSRAGQRTTSESTDSKKNEKENQSLIKDYDRLYKNASISELEKSLKHLDKLIEKNHNKSIGEVTNGYRSTRKAVAAGAVDTFRKNRLDLEKYIKYRKSNESTIEKIYSDSNLTHSIPKNLLNEPLSLGDIVKKMELITTEGINSDKTFRQEVIKRIAELNPNLKVYIATDLDTIHDKLIRLNLIEGGFYAIDSGISYIYPKSEAWIWSLPELIGHELIHASTQKHIDSNKLSDKQLKTLDKLKEAIWSNNIKNADQMDPDTLDRLNYALLSNYPHEMLTVFGAETNARKILQQIGILDKFDQLFNQILKDANNDNGQIQQGNRSRTDQRGITKTISGDAEGTATKVSELRTTAGTSENISRSDDSKSTSSSDSKNAGLNSSESKKTYNPKSIVNKIKPKSENGSEKIEDFGEKIGGARKDAALTIRRKNSSAKEIDDRPTWAKRFEILEVETSINPSENGKWIITDTRKKDFFGNPRRITREFFDSEQEANRMLPVIAVSQKHRVWTAGNDTYAIYREVTDRKRIQVVEQRFKTRDEAMLYMASHAKEILETNTTFGEADIPRPENTVRTGVSHRTGDAKDSDFSRVFGFRGVEFGNWNNQVERQELLNDAFDGLMDLAEVIGIPPEAISLNGELGLAFGARGQGLSGAKAHYEPERVVINLTKMNGAGSLAHEWWHALDHYFGRVDGRASSTWIVDADGSRRLEIKKRFEDMSATSGFSLKSNVREEVREAYNTLVQTIFKKAEGYVDDTAKVESFVSDARQNLKDQLDKLRTDLERQLDPKYYKRFNKAASTEQLVEFDTVAEVILSGQSLTTELRYKDNPNSRNPFSGSRWSNDALDKLSEIYKTVRGKTGFNGDQKGVIDRIRQYMSTYSQRLKLLAEAQSGAEKTKMIPTQFAMDAKELDQGRGTDYWITVPEMTARAFQGYVEDKISDQGGYSPFLNFGPENAAIFTPWGWKRPFPQGEERQSINKAFDKLINQFKTEKTDQGTRLFSRQEEQIQKGHASAQVRQVLVKRFGEKTIATLENQGKLRIVETYEVDGVEGYYHNGRVTLVANNLTETSTIATFLHELGGHGGFQNTMSKKQYFELMRQFDEMVKRGHPMAVEAKRLAEREANPETQQLEYLPYILTLASTMQTTNALQKNALQQFIDKIVSAVKAFVFDKLGVNLNLSPDDLIALAERMIERQKSEPTSVDRVRVQYFDTHKWMKAPNGKPTNLTEQQWLQVRTPEFKSWFGDWENDPKNASEILDENGEPKVVYHGTSAQFTEFKLGGGLLGRGIYLTDNINTAEMYANIRSINKSGLVMPLFVNMRNTFKTFGNPSRSEIVAATETGKYQGVLHSFEDDKILVALEPNQVKLAIGNVGSFDKSDSNILYSRQAAAEDFIKNIVNSMNKQGMTKLKIEAGYKAKHGLQYVLGALGRRQLAEIYQKLLPQLKQYSDMVAVMDADQNEVAALSDEIVREWADLSDEKELAKVMHDATIAEIDPADPYMPGDSFFKYTELRKAFDALSPEAKKIYIKARDAYTEHHRNVRHAISDRILRSSMSNQKKTELLKQMDANFFGYIRGVYFPLQRFGKYVVLVRNDKNQVISVSRAETLSEAHKLREILQKEYPNSKVNKPILDKEFSVAQEGVSRGFMTTLFNELGSFGLNAKKQAELEDILGQLYLKSLPDLSYAKHSIHRKGTAGFSQDARRAFAQNMFHGGSYLAKLRYKDQLEDLLDGMQKHATEQANANDNYDQPVAQRVIDEMNKRHKNMMEANSHPLSTALTSLGFLYYLGLSPASAIVNLLQTALVAYPQMGAKWGYDKAGRALLDASNDFRKGLKFEGFNPKNWENDITNVLKGDDLKAYNEAVRRGVIDVTMAHDLAGIAQGEDSGVMWKMRPIMRLASVLFHNAERFNREVTFIASYRLAREKGSKHDQAFEEAMDSTYKGHFDYSAGNRPRLMQGNIAKVIFLFKQFGQNMLYTLIRAAHQSFKAETPQARTEARQALVGMIASHTLFAGVMGLPLVGSILAMLSMLGGNEDEPWDAEVALRNALADLIGVKASEVIMKGAPRLTPVDLSGRVGINNLLIPELQDGLEGKNYSDAMVMSALGPVVGMLTNTFKGLGEIGEGHKMRGVETMSPIFLRSPLRSIRYGTEGAKDKTGVMIKDDIGMFGLASQAIGFSPSEVRLATEGRSAIYSHTKRLDERRTDLMTDYVRAIQRGDKEEQESVWKDIQKFNEKNPSRRISRIQAMQSLRQREKRVDKAEHGIYLPNKKKSDAEIGRFAWDE